MMHKYSSDNDSDDNWSANDNDGCPSALLRSLASSKPRKKRQTHTHRLSSKFTLEHSPSTDVYIFIKARTHPFLHNDRREDRSALSPLVTTLLTGSGPPTSLPQLPQGFSWGGLLSARNC